MSVPWQRARCGARAAPAPPEDPRREAGIARLVSPWIEFVVNHSDQERRTIEAGVGVGEAPALCAQTLITRR